MTETVTGYSSRHADSVFERTSSRLRALQPDHPRVYAVAAVSEHGRRRWWKLSEGVREGRIEVMYRRHAAEMRSADIAAEVVATALVHAVVGRVAALWVMDGRAWDPGLENLWVHNDNDGGLDWAGLEDTTLRVLDGDPMSGRAGVVALPCERAMAVWLAHRCEASLTLVYEGLARCSRLSVHRFWSLVGQSVVGAATYVPDLARTDAMLGARRGQALLAALGDRGPAVRRDAFVPG
ncbi:hypothetical protein IU449_02300 [Nocardia higoensis]|uniref:Iron reductase n=1 Tax=Nocardia higoensis TaxID=228599 RepID=A0ABS0D4I2_9NOCA|nr:hypothetical protein [Nocardia higoensis]MBF6353386.1 hypothetical protein [Nocardia higoensis]